MYIHIHFSKVVYIDICAWLYSHSQSKLLPAAGSSHISVLKYRSKVFRPTQIHLAFKQYACWLKLLLAVRATPDARTAGRREPARGLHNDCERCADTHI